jgi:hypothetical protein
LVAKRSALAELAVLRLDPDDDGDMPMFHESMTNCGVISPTVFVAEFLAAATNGTWTRSSSPSPARSTGYGRRARISTP